MTDHHHPYPDASLTHFPSHNEPRVWVITAGDSPIGISVARQILAHGDYVLLGLAYSVLDRDQCRREGFDAFLAEVEEHRDEGWNLRMKTVPLNIRCAHLPQTKRDGHPVRICDRETQWRLSIKKLMALVAG